jgi:hypothetical protein
MNCLRVAVILQKNARENTKNKAHICADCSFIVVQHNGPAEWRMINCFRTRKTPLTKAFKNLIQFPKTIPCPQPCSNTESLKIRIKKKNHGKVTEMHIPSHFWLRHLLRHIVQKCKLNTANVKFKSVRSNATYKNAARLTRTGTSFADNNSSLAARMTGQTFVFPKNPVSRLGIDIRINPRYLLIRRCIVVFI